MTKSMKAAAIKEWGDTDKFEFLQLPIPKLEADDVLIKVAYAGVNPADWKMRAGYLAAALGNANFPFVIGLDSAGVVVAAGERVEDFSVGDRVVSGNNIFQEGKPGSYAEYIVVNKSRVASIPETISFDSAAALPTAGITAWQALFADDKGAFQKGKNRKVLINGASGGVGSFAVQLAKWAGAEVATTCSGANLDYVRSLRADFLIDYKTQNIGDEIRKWAPEGIDLIIDAISAGSLADPIDLLKQGGRLVSIATLTDDGDVEASIAEAELKGCKKIYALVSDSQFGKELQKIVELINAGEIEIPPIESFEFDDVAQAHKKLEGGHVRGKLVLNVLDEQ